MISKVRQFREHIERSFQKSGRIGGGSFGEILCHELHEEVFNPRMQTKTGNDGYCTGLTFKELAAKWGISVSFLGELIADHCRKLEKNEP